MGVRIGLALAVLLGVVLFIANRDVPEGLAGRPEIAVDFPAAAAQGSTQTARFTIRNPGPNEMKSVFLAFARVGPAPGDNRLPFPIVDPGAQHVNPAIVSITPEPVASSIEAVVFRFGSLDVGESMTVEFELRVPAERGPAANSVTAYPGENPELAKGVRLGTEVTG